MTSPSDPDSPTARPRMDRYEPGEIEPRWQQRWEELGLHHTDLADAVATGLLPAHDVPLPVGRPAHRPLVHQDAHRRACALPAHERPQRLLPHRLRCLRPARRECRHQERRPPGHVDDAQHREHAPPAALHGCHLRLVERGGDLPARVLPLEPVVLPAVPQGRPGLPPDGPGRLVPQGPGRPGARAGGRRRSRLLALRDARHQARPGAVVPAHHQVRRRAPRLRGHRLARARAPHADELDRAVRGSGRRLPHRPLRAPCRRPGAARLHDASRHALRGHLHGPRARASPGGRAHGTRAARGRGGLRGRGPPGDGDRATLHGA